MLLAAKDLLGKEEFGVAQIIMLHIYSEEQKGRPETGDSIVFILFRQCIKIDPFAHT
jgi:hypothetical protein